MEKVTGIGGLFFRARDPEYLGQWYRDHLGVTPVPSGYAESPWRQEAGPCVFAPFPQTTAYFGDDSRGWMVNFRVRDLDAMVAQLREAGIAVELDCTIPRAIRSSCGSPMDQTRLAWNPRVN